MHIQCSNCQTTSQVPDNSQGKKARCPKCGNIIPIPMVPSPAEVPLNEVPEQGVVFNEAIENLPPPPIPREASADRDRTRQRPRRTADDDLEDDYDDRPRRRSRRGRSRQDDDALATIIPYKNGMALAAYYCGVFGLIPCVGAILGPLALIFGIVGLRKVKESPEAHGTGHAIAGIVLGTLVILGHLIFLVFILISISHKK